MNKKVIGKVVKSPYDLWIDKGNTGTESDFLLSLKGPKGDPGGKNFEDLVFVRHDDEGNTIVKSKFSDGSYGSEFKIMRAVSDIKPNYFEKICIYYGYPNAINGSWNIETSISTFSKYDMVVFGDNYNDPTHEAHSDMVQIINGLKSKSPGTKIFGYVPCSASGGTKDLTTEQIKELINLWNNLGIHGIFLDEFGYDYYNTRARQNEIITHVKSYGMKCFVNSWEDKYVFSNLPLTISWMPDFFPNPDSLPCLLDENDYSLYENMFWDAHSGTQKHQEGWVIYKAYDYYNKAQEEYAGKTYNQVYKTKTVTLDGIHSSLENTPQGIEMRTISLYLARMLNISGISFGNENWGSRGKYYMWDLPDVNLARTKDMLDPIKITMSDNGEGPNKFESNINGDTLVVNWTTADMDMSTGVRDIHKNGNKLVDAWETLEDKVMKLQKIVDQLVNGGK